MITHLIKRPRSFTASISLLAPLRARTRICGTHWRWLPGHGHEIQHLSILCPGYVQPVSRYRICPIPVPARSKLCQPSADFPWGWTEIGPQDPEFVKVLSKKSMKLKFFHLDTLWTDVGLVKTVIRGLILGFWKLSKWAGASPSTPSPLSKGLYLFHLILAR